MFEVVVITTIGEMSGGCQIENGIQLHLSGTGGGGDLLRGSAYRGSPHAGGT